MCYPALPPHSFAASVFLLYISWTPLSASDSKYRAVYRLPPLSKLVTFSSSTTRGERTQPCAIYLRFLATTPTLLGLPDVWRSCLRQALTFSAPSLILSSYVHRPILRAFDRDCHVHKYLFLHRKQVRRAYSRFDRENPSTLYNWRFPTQHRCNDVPRFSLWKIPLLHQLQPPLAASPHHSNSGSESFHLSYHRPHLLRTSFARHSR